MVAAHSCVFKNKKSSFRGLEFLRCHLLHYLLGLAFFLFQMFLKQRKAVGGPVQQWAGPVQQWAGPAPPWAGLQWVELQQSHLQLLVVCLAAAVRLLGRVFVGVKHQTDTTVITQRHMFYT